MTTTSINGLTTLSLRAVEEIYAHLKDGTVPAIASKEISGDPTVTAWRVVFVTKDNQGSPFDSLNDARSALENVIGGRVLRSLGFTKKPSRKATKYLNRLTANHPVKAVKIGRDVGLNIYDLLNVLAELEGSYIDLYDDGCISKVPVPTVDCADQFQY